MVQQQSRHTNAWLIAGLIGFGMLSRLIPHPWNATPVMAIALLVPLALVAGSDALLGWHAVIPFTWGAFVLTGMLGWWLRGHARPGRVLTAAVSGSCLFFVISNFGVWLMEGMYPHTAAGLIECYAAAVPFFRNGLLGDLVYTAVLFGAYTLASGRLPSGRIAHPAA